MDDKNAVPLPVDSISLSLDEGMRIADLRRLLAGVAIVLHSGRLNIRVELAQLNVWGSPVNLGIRPGETLPTLMPRNLGRADDET